MERQKFNKGIGLTALGSFWWGVIGVIYFKYITFIGHIELVVHRCLWTTFTLVVTTFFFSKWQIFFNILPYVNIKAFYRMKLEANLKQICFTKLY